MPGQPTHELLDRAVSDRPVIIHNTSEHALWINATALAFAGITDQPVADPDEERNVVRDASGHPSGLLLESAMELVNRAVFAALTQDQKLALLRDASRYLNRFGMTSVVNATGSLPEIELYAALRDRGELTVRTRTALGAVAFRHSLATVLITEEQVDPKTAQGILRHANSDVTMQIYTHAQDEAKRKALEKFEARLVQ